MNKYENHIYLIICEVTLKLYKETNFVSHSSYCKMMSHYMIDGKLTGRDILHISKIISVLEIVFSMSDVEASKYVKKFFIDGKYSKFESIVASLKVFYPNSGDISVLK
jgi:hypothetical protein